MNITTRKFRTEEGRYMIGNDTQKAAMPYRLKPPPVDLTRYNHPETSDYCIVDTLRGQDL